MFAGIEGESLLCTETLPSSTPPTDDAQLPAQASATHHLHTLPDHTWTKAHLPAAKDVQFALIVPETFLASNQHLLARAALVTSSGEDIRGAAGAVVTVQAADIGVAGVKQHETFGHRIVNAPTLLREVVSLTPCSTIHGAINGFDGAQKVVSSSALLVPAVSSGDVSHHQLAGLAEVAAQQAQVSPLSPTSGSHSQLLHHPQQQQQSSSPPALPASPASEGMHSGRPGTGSGHSQGHTPTSGSQDQHPHSHAMLSAGASAGPSAGLGVFRGSLTHGEPVSRVLGVGSGGGQYSGGAGGNSSASSMGPYSSLYSVHGQPSPLATMSPYPGFFTQYPAAAPHYSTASFVASARFPPFESCSAVLASLGSHVQHGGHASPQGQAGARASYLPAAMGQYSHRSLSSSSSPGPSTHSPSGSAASFSLREREREALLQQQSRERERERSPPHHGPGMSSDSPPEDKGLLHSPGLHYPHRASPAGLLKDIKGDPRDPFHKVPSGKEGSRKHRILLTRPPDIATEAAYGQAKGRAQSMKGEEELASKRTKYMTSSMGASASVSSSPTDPHVFLAPHALGPGPPASTGHYAHHNTANSTTTISPSSSSSATTSPTSSQAARTPESAGASPGSGGSNLPPHLHYPPHFIKGSIIQLANGDLKRVEDLQTEDFVSSAQVSADLKVDSSTVVRIEEHPELGIATLGFSVGEHRVQVGTASIHTHTHTHTEIAHLPMLLLLSGILCLVKLDTFSQPLF